MVTNSVAVSRSVIQNEKASVTATRCLRNIICNSITLKRDVRLILQSSIAFERQIYTTVKTSLGLARLINQIGRTSIGLKRSIDFPFGYDVYARNVATDVVTYLGFIDGYDSPLELTGITLADAVYEIEFWLKGFYWQDQRYTTKFRVEISSGSAASAEPPPLRNVRTVQIQNIVQLIWEYEEVLGALVPDSFGIWTDTGGPPSTAGPPDIVRPVFGQEQYDYPIDQAGSPLYIAIAARTAGVNGPVSNVSEPVPLTDPDSPSDQFVEEETP